MKPSAGLNWIQGLGVAYATLGAVRRDRYIARVRGSVDEGYGFVAVRTAIESRDKVPGATDTT